MEYLAQFCLFKVDSVVIANCVNVKSKLGILSWLGIKEQKNKEEIKRTAKVMKQGRLLTYICRYTSGYLIPMQID